MPDDELVMRIQDLLTEAGIQSDCNFLTNKYKLGRKTYKTKTEFIEASTMILVPIILD